MTTNYPYTFKSGKHAPNSGEGCAMEWASIVAGEPFSDHPPCTSEVIAVFMRTWNDGLPTNEDRTRLLAPLVGTRETPGPIIGTYTDDEAIEDRRAWLATDWLVRTYAAAWLRLAGLDAYADALAALPELVDAASSRAARPTIDAARAARGAAWDDSWRTARDAAEVAANAGAGVAAWVAAMDAANAAAMDAPWVAAMDAANVGAWVAVMDAASVGAWVDTMDAAEDAARDALAPTAATLQQSAVELVRRMCAVGGAS